MAKIKPVIYIVGPTASGKTGLSIELAKKFGGEIISGDSMQVYKEMHIASAAPDKDEKQAIPHHLFEFLNPNESFSVSEYVKLADQVIAEIHYRGKLPIVVGGTGLYINSLSQHIDFGEDNDKEFRNILEEQLKISSLDKFYEYLAQIDPSAAEKISPNDKKRIFRAIEIYHTSGKTKTQREKESRISGPIYENLFIGLDYKNRETLYDRINKRVDIMVGKGLLEEARATLDSVNGTGAQAIGHKELYGFLKGEKSMEDAIQHLKMQTRRYAKRQLTWFRKNKDINWIFMDEIDDPIFEASMYIKSFLK